jgi:hypothetical protein
MCSPTPGGTTARDGFLLFGVPPHRGATFIFYDALGPSDVFETEQLRHLFRANWKTVHVGDYRLETSSAESRLQL